MTGPLRCLALIVLVSGFQPTVFGQEAPTRTPEQWVAELGHPSFTRREKASEELWKLGEEARPALEAALKNSSNEVVRRAKLILEKFDSGNLPNVSPELKALIDQFRAGQEADRTQAIRKLCRIGDAGPATLRRLIQKEITDPEARYNFFQELCQILRAEVPLLILQGQLTRAGNLLELNTLDPLSPGMIDYALFCANTGTAAQAAQKLEQRKAENTPAGLAAAKTLVFLYRASGDLARARSTALAVEKRDPNFRAVRNSLLEDVGAWAELADRTEIGEVNSRDGLRIFHLRMANRADEAKKLADRQKDQDLVGNSRRTGLVDEATLALMLNNRPLEGMDRLRTQASAPHILADLLASRLRFQDAMDLVSNSTTGDEASALDRGLLRQLHGTRKGRLLWQLGQRDAAAQVFNKLAEEITGGPENRDGRPYTDFTIAQLVRTEVRSGRYDLACEHLATALAVSGYDGTRPQYYGQDAFELIFDRNADVAEFWWRVLRQRRPDGETAASTMKKVRRLLTGQASSQELETALKHGQSDKGPTRRRPNLDGRRDEPINEPDEHHTIKAVALAAVYRAAAKPTDAIQVLTAKADNWPKETTAEPLRPEETFSSVLSRSSRSWIFGVDEQFRFWVELGDLLLEQGQPIEAAKRYLQGWQANPENGLLLYLSGKALLKANQEQEAQKRIKAAHLVSLGNARIRGRFLEELITRGFSADVREEIRLIRQCGWISELHIGNVWNQVARGAILLKDFDTAAMAHNRAIYYLLRTPGVSYVEGYAYLTVPQAVRVATARHLIGTGKIVEGVELAKDCLSILPGNNDLAIGVIPVLDRAGHKAEADALFKLVWESFNEILKKHPESAWARSQAAWLAAGTLRELDTAFEYAKKAVELDPTYANFQETLAEVYFRRGDRDNAVAIMKKLISQDRGHFHYRRQLERYQSAPVDAPIMETDD